MLILLDCRETKLIEECKMFLSGKDELSHIKMEVRNLPIGDIIIMDGTDKERIIVERKSVNDLASSIRDSRYKEQSFRLKNCDIPNHDIFYVIEGSYASLGPRYNRKTILSAITSLAYYKGFSVHRTFSIKETAEWLMRFADKLYREGKPGFYSKPATNEINIKEDVGYSSVCKRVKKDNITVDNIGEIMLMQIPGVSSSAASAILKVHHTLNAVIKSLEADPKALDCIYTTTKTGKERKLNKSAGENICKFLISQ